MFIEGVVQFGLLTTLHHLNPNQFNGVRKLSWDQPSYNTITSHIAKDSREFIHSQENRRLTVRECLRLMSVPDTYVIPPHIPLSQQYTLVGNGVAFLVAKVLSQSILDCLEVDSVKGASNKHMTIFHFI
ncbi:modification methylase AgeI [Bacillus cereus]|uniref:DNA (cytosine-5-)-methyltransferase n=1 Tax=Bacillus cereus TaxID=1396 RepID=A0A2A8R5Y4_BACCE|nr:modification methylase AgeI [Bacillus cereus]PFN20310.1 modification methylase AgeI [Bacillus cereus]